MDFVPLHCHSTFSFHAGVCTVDELVTRAKALGFPALALTDTDRMSGLILFYCACRKAGIKPILGVELTDPSNAADRLVLLARDAQGYGDLCEIITHRQTDDSFSFEKEFTKPWPKLVFLTASPRLLTMLAATPNGQSLYGELINTSDATRTRSRLLEEEAERLTVPLIVSNDSYFLDKSDHETHRLLTAIGHVSTLSRLKEGEYASSGAFLRSEADMAGLFPRHLNAIAETRCVADLCNVELDLGKWIMPCIEVPEGFTPESYLAKLAREGLRANYGGKAAFEQACRIQEMELDTIDKLGYPSYFLIVKDVHDWASSRLCAAPPRGNPRSEVPPPIALIVLVSPPEQYLLFIAVSLPGPRNRFPFFLLSRCSRR